VNKTEDEESAPKGHLGGPYFGVNLFSAVGSVTPEANWFERIGLEVSLLRIRDSSNSRGYQSASHKFLHASIRYALYDSEKSLWKPTIALVRTVGTDRLNDEPYRATTSIGFQISYGL
jgi:hypothetical protein